MLGFINIYKPSGMTSNAVVQKIKKKFNINKIGHMGTLDPMACGILPIAIGKATRLFDYSLEKKKSYIAQFDFGFSTDTLDTTGNIVSSGDLIPTLSDILFVKEKLIGNISQIPPNFSAKNINGTRAYKLAREGIDFELKPKEITIYSLNFIEQIDDNKFKFEIVCSSGTYIRSIGRDLAKLLNTTATMSFLERTTTGEFNLNTAITLDVLLTKDNIEDVLINPIDIFKTFDIVDINSDQFIDLKNGKKLSGFLIKNNTFVLCENKIVGVCKANSDVLRLDTYLGD